MKKTFFKRIAVLLLILLFQTHMAKAQQSIPEIEANGRSYSQIFDSLSTGLIPSRIPYGVLMDRVYAWSALSSWSNTDTLSASRLFQTWYDSENAVMDSTIRPNYYLTMRDIVQQQLYEVKLPVLAFNYQFGFIDSNALNDGRMSEVNGILTDNNNASPYFSKQVTFAGLATEEVIANKNYALQYSSSLILNNTSHTIQNIVVTNLTANIQYILAANTAQTIQFATAGKHLLRFAITLSNGSSFISHQYIVVKDIGYSEPGLDPIGVNCNPVNELLTSTIPFQGYEETIATNSHADVHYYYHTQTPTSNDCEPILRKPIIIVDGFDPQDDRSYDELYKDYLKYSKNGTPTRLGDELRDKGYDVIILNFPLLGSKIEGMVDNIPTTVKVNGTNNTINLAYRDGGSDYIERNAMLLVQLIQQVNATLAANGSIEKSVIVGPSMGGLVSRYALAYMEKQQSLGTPNMNHNCRLWVSFDSPHDGANISVAVQQSLGFLGYVGQSIDSRGNYELKLRSTAARQQLIEQEDGFNSIAAFHNTFYTNLKNNGLPGSNGFPVNLRKVNLLNGVGNGGNTYWPGAEFLNGEAFKYNWFVGNIKVFDIEDNFFPAPGNTIRTSKTMITLKKPLRFITQEKQITNNNSRGSMDAVQGSVNNEIINGIKNGVTKGLSTEKNITENWYNVRPEFCFIPTVSALGFKQPVSNWHTRVDNRNLLCNNEINFDGYFMPQTNEKHIFLTEANVNWVIQEIDKGQPGCPTICAFSLTGGSDIICTNSISTYTLDVPAPTGATVQWILPSNLQLVSSTNNSVTVKGVGTGTVILKAKINNPCGADAEIKKTINIAAEPFVQAWYNSPSNSSEPASVTTRFNVNWNDACFGNITALTTSISPGSTISWLGDPSSPSITWIQSGNNVNFSFTEPGQTITLYASLTSDCGNKGYNFLFRSVNGNCGGSPLRVTMSPNPTSNNLSVDVNIQEMQQNGYNNPSWMQIREIKIYDKFGVLRKRKQFGPGTQNIVLPVHDLPGDVYNVHVTNGVHNVVRQIIIQH